MSILNKVNVFIISSVLTLCSSPAFSQALVYASTNHSVGGSSFNSSHLFNIANSQNKYPNYLLVLGIESEGVVDGN